MYSVPGSPGVSHSNSTNWPHSRTSKMHTVCCLSRGTIGATVAATVRPPSSVSIMLIGPVIGGPIALGLFIHGAHSCRATLEGHRPTGQLGSLPPEPFGQYLTPADDR